MATMSALKKAILAPALLATVFATQAVASDLDKDGFRNDKDCDTLEVIKGSIVEVAKQQTTGLKASNDKWEMEIYKDGNGRWTLMGINKSPKDEYEQACILMSGAPKFPYTSEAFYSKFFKPGTNVAQNPVAPKLN